MPAWLLLVLVLALAANGCVHGLLDWIRVRPVAARSLAGEPDMVHLHWSYKENGVCLPFDLTLTQGELDPNETLEEFRERVRDTKIAFMEDFPVDPSCPQQPPLPQG